MAVDPIIKQKADDIRHKIYGKEVRESLASGIEAMSEDVVSVTGRQATVEEQFQSVLDETTGKDVISAPEIILARNGEVDLKTRLDEEHAEVTAQLAQTAQVVNVKAFGATGDNVTDDTLSIQNAIDYAVLNNLKTIYIPKGTYKIAGTINISGLSAFDITFIGDGMGRDGRGVSFIKETTGYIFNVDLTYGAGGWRAVNFRNITFRGEPNKTANGIKVVFSQLCHFYNCEFLQLDKAVTITGNSHYAKFEKCTFIGANKGIYIPYSGDDEHITGNANNGIIDQCFFTQVATPVDMGAGSGWSWYDTDFEGDNGTIIISDYNVLNNIRIERNENNAYWLQINGYNNKVHCGVYSAGGNMPKCTFKILGDKNEITLKSSSGGTILDNQSTGKNNLIEVGDYNRLLDGSLFTGDYDVSNKIVVNETLTEENLLEFSHDPTEWTVERGEATITHNESSKEFTIVKNSDTELVLSKTIEGTFPIGTKLIYIGEGLYGLAGGGFEVGIEANGTTSATGIVGTSKNNIVGQITLNAETVNPKIKITNRVGGSGVAVKFKGTAVQQETLKDYFETRETANVEKSDRYSAIPTNGYHAEGTILYNTNPIANGYLGWVCVTAGNPGTWKGFGLIES